MVQGRGVGKRYYKMGTPQAPGWFAFFAIYHYNGPFGDSLPAIKRDGAMERESRGHRREGGKEVHRTWKPGVIQWRASGGGAEGRPCASHRQIRHGEDGMRTGSERRAKGKCQVRPALLPIDGSFPWHAKCDGALEIPGDGGDHARKGLSHPPNRANQSVRMPHTYAQGAGWSCGTQAVQKGDIVAEEARPDVRTKPAWITDEGSVLRSRSTL